jgi:hypothetical protein
MKVPKVPFLPWRSGPDSPRAAKLTRSRGRFGLGAGQVRGGWITTVPNLDDLRRERV